jgi:hypothetical protein
MKQHLFIISLTILAVSFGLPGCCCKKQKKEPELTQQEKEAQDIIMKNEGYVKATVINYNLDGCGWMIELEDKTKKEVSEGIPETFKVEGKKVWAKFSPVKGMNSICMAGQIVNLWDIKERK